MAITAASTARQGGGADRFSAVPDEGEVLFRPCTTFRVVKKSVTENPKPIRIDGEDVPIKFPRQFLVELEER
jgi:hypothetical protein